MINNNLTSLLSLFKRFLEESGLSKVSVKNYVSDIRKFLEYSDFSTAESITTDQIESYLNSFPKNKLTTKNRHAASLRRFSTFLETTYQIQLSKTNTSSTVNQSTQSQTSLLEAFKSHLISTGKSQSTIKNYLSDVNSFFRWLTPDQTPDQDLVTTDNIKDYIKYLKINQSKPSLITRREASLHKLFQFCHPETTHTTQILPLKWFRRFTPQTTTSSNKSVSNPLNRLYNRYSSLPFTPYLHLAILVLFTAALALFGYNQIIRDTKQSQAFPSALTRPTRQLSFQARLTDTSDTPITTPTNVSFKLWNQTSGGTEGTCTSAGGENCLYKTGTCSVSPDQDGIFNTLLGDGTCGAEIPSNVFTENQNIYLEVLVGATTLSPRQQIATVGYALNTETLQGYPAGTGTSTIPYIDASGIINISAASPTIKSSSGTFSLEGQALTLTTTTASNGNITVAPDGTGQIQFLTGTTSTDSLRITNANLTSGSLISGYVGNNSSTGELLRLSSGSVETDRFVVGTGGQTDIDAIAKGKAALIVNQLDSGPIFAASASGINQFLIANSGNITASGTIDGLTGINSSGTITFSSLNTAGGIVYASNGSGDLAVSTAGSGGQCLQSTGGGAPTWGACGGSSYWQRVSGAVMPTDLTDDLLLGSTATDSARIALINVASGTPTATIGGTISVAGDGVISTTRNQSLILGNNDTGNLEINTDFISLNQATTINSNGTLSLNTLNNQSITTGTGQITLAGNVDATNGLDVTSADLTVGGANFSVAPGTGNITTAGDLALNGGDLTSTGSITVTPNAGSNLNVALSGTGDFAVNTNDLYVDTSAGRVGIGTTAPANKLDVNGDVRVQTLAAGATDTVVTHSSGVLQSRTIDPRVWGSSLVDGSGVANYVARWSDANTLTTGALLDNGTTVGIGVTTPDAFLDITPATTARAQINLSSSTGTNPSTPVNGDLWWNGNNLYFYNGSINVDLMGANIWTDAGTYVYPTNGETLGNSASAGSNKLAGIYLADSAPLTLGTDNDTSFSFNNTTSALELTLGNNDLNVDSNTLFVDGSANRVGIGTTNAVSTLTVAGDLTPSATATYDLGTSNAYEWRHANLTGSIIRTGVTMINLATQTFAGSGDWTFAAGTFFGGGTTYYINSVGTGNLNNLTLTGTTGLSLSGTGAGIGFSGTGTHNISASTGTLQLGAFSLNGNQTVNTDFDIIPAGTTGTNDIGSAGIPFDNIYATTYYQGGTTIDSQYVNVTGDTMSGTLTFDNPAIDITSGSNQNISIVPNGTGKVGIGTTTPNYLLDVNGTFGVGGNSTLGDASSDSVTVNAATLSLVNASTLDLANTSTTSLNIESGLLDLDTTNSRVGIGTTAPGFTLEVNGTARINGNTTIGDASADTLTVNAASQTYANPTTLDLANSSTISLNIESGLLDLDTTNSRVGIGTTAPNSTLQVAGRTTTTDFTMTNGAVNNYVLTSDGSGNASWTDLSVSATAGPWTYSAPFLYPDNATDFVGIGTSTTTAMHGLLSVTGARTGKALVVFNQDGDQDILTASVSGTTKLRLTNAGSLLFNQASSIDAAGTLSINTTNNQAITTGTGQITLAGNVDATNGLDVTSADLTVGGANFSVTPGTGNITTAGDLALNGGDLTSTGSITVTPNAGSNLNVALSGTGDFAVNTNDLYVDTSAGRVGINIAAPGFDLEVNGTARINGNFTVGDASADTLTINAATLSLANASTLDLANGSTTALNIESGLLDIDTSNSRIGIGTTAPSTLLHISSASSPALRLVDGTQGAGYVLQSDVNGNASWANISVGSAGPWTYTAPYIYPDNISDYVAVGTQTADAIGMPGVFTVNGYRGANALVVLNEASANGDILTASVSGTTRLTLNNAGSLMFNQASTINATGTLSLNTTNNQAITTGNGQITLAGNVDATNGLDVTNADLTVGGANYSVSQATGNITTAGDLALNGGDITTAVSDLTLNPAGGQVLLTDTDTLIIGGHTGNVAYNVISNAGGTPTNAAISSDNDLYIQGDLEFGGNLYGPATGIIGYWQRASQAISPTNISDDVLVGAVATASAFARIAGTPGANSWINNGYFGIGTTAPTAHFDIHGNTWEGLFSISDGSQDIATISSTLSQFNNPVSFTSAGDVSVAYDLNFTNPTSSYIKSAAPMYIAAGESFNSSDLTLRTYNNGDLVLDIPGGATLMQAQAWDLADSSTTSLNIESGLLDLDTTNSRVGIGTTAPGFTLEVNGTARINGNTTIGDASADTLTVNAATLSLVNASTLNLANTSTTSLNIESGLMNFDTTNSRIGIGTTAPGFTLEVNGTARINGNTTIGDASADTLTVNAATLSLVNASTLNLANTSTTSLNIESGLMNFDTTNSRIGIGTTAPVSKLEVVDTSATSPRGIVSTQYSADANGSKVILRKARGSLTTPAAISSQDNIGDVVFSGYGTSFTAGAIISSLATQTWNGTNNGAILSFSNVPMNSTTMTERMRIAENGWVGIGDASPLMPLEVATSSGTLQIASFTCASGDCYTQTSNGTQIAKYGVDASGSFFGSASNHDTRLITNNITRATLNYNGTNGFFYPATDNTYDLGLGASNLDWRYLNLQGGIYSGGTEVVNVATRTLSGGGDWSVTNALTVGTSLTITCTGILDSADCVTVHGGTGKINVGTIDPPYTINGDKYATYVPAMVGQREEVTGKVATSELVPNLGYRYSINLTNQPKASDLWLFAKVTDLLKDGNLANLTVILTPNSAAKVWYEIDEASKILNIYSSNPTTISYRLSSTRFDSDKWLNTRASGSDGFILVNPDQSNNLVASTPVTLPTIEEITPEKYQIKLGNNIIQEVGSYASLLVANIEAGAGKFRELTGEKIVSPFAQIDTLEVNNLTAQDATVTGTLYASEINSPTISTLALSQQNIQSQIEQLTSGYATASSILADIQDKYKNFDALNQNTTNASVSGQIDLTNTPLLIADTIMINSALITNSINSNDNATLYLQPTGGSINLLAGLMTLMADGKVVINGDLIVNGNILANQSKVDSFESSVATISGSLALGASNNATESANGNLLNVYGSTGDTVATIDASGSAKLNEVTAAALTTDGLIIASAATESATATSSAGLTSNATIGTAIIRAGETELFIANSKLNANTLVYLTPISDTKNQVIYVKSKQEGVGFTTAINAPIDADLKFNYWLIKTL